MLAYIVSILKVRSNCIVFLLCSNATMCVYAEVRLSVGQTTYSAQESDGSVTLSYVLNREAVRDVSFDVINTDGTATGGGVGTYVLASVPKLVCSIPADTKLNCSIPL